MESKSIKINTSKNANVVLLLDHRLRDWSNIKTTLGRRAIS